MKKVNFATQPAQYHHWKLSFDSEIATLAMAVSESHGLNEGYHLKLNSYDLAVDIELADAIARIRFEHPEVKVVVITSLHDKVFCAGANIFMLGQSTHPFKVNFCKFTNETRLYIEEMSTNAGVKFLAALNGTTAGGGYELALACDEILLVDDSNSAVSLPEVPLLGVLPGTGGLTRVVDKRHVRRDLADMFCTIAEGVRGKRAVEWNLVDAIAPKSEWQARVKMHAERLAQATTQRAQQGIALTPLNPTVSDDKIQYRHVNIEIDRARRMATLTIAAPAAHKPENIEELHQRGDETWMFRAFRELDDAILQLRLNYLDTGTWVFRTQGEAENVIQAENAIMQMATQNDWLAKEILWHAARVLRRIDVTSRSMVTLLEPGSCFAGCLAELVFCADRSFMLDDSEADAPATLCLSMINKGLLPMENGLSRLQSRYFGHAEQLGRVYAHIGHALAAKQVGELGLVTTVADEMDYDDVVRIFLEERASLSPDALTAMEANLRFVGPETLGTKIFARLSAWQNWVFSRENAVGAKGALTNYGKATRPEFDFRRC